VIILKVLSGNKYFISKNEIQSVECSRELKLRFSVHSFTFPWLNVFGVEILVYEE
jgi:hypothetical protein